MFYLLIFIFYTLHQIADPTQVCSTSLYVPYSSLVKLSILYNLTNSYELRGVVKVFYGVSIAPRYHATLEWVGRLIFF